MTPSTQKTFWQELRDKGVLSLVHEVTNQQAIDMAETYGTHNYKPIPVNVVRGKGSLVWDADGKEYIDCIGAYSAVSAGHLSPFIVETINKQLEEVAVVSRSYYNSEVSLFLKGLCEFAGLDKACPMNSGAEAIETCIKLARKWGYTKKGVPLDQAEIIVCSDNFHGRTTTIVGFSTEETYKKLFGPYGPGFKVVPFGDIDALKAAITPNTVGFLAEPIQAEGGIIVAPDGYFTKVREVCTENNVLLIWDEIQAGFYRTGYRFAWQYEKGAEPDLIAVGKPLGGGILPVSAAVGKDPVMEVFGPGDHGSTFGGNPLGAVVALAAMAEMETEDFGGKAQKLGEIAFDTIRNMPFKEIIDVRGRGLLIGVEFDHSIDLNAMAVAMREHGILTKQTRKYTFRLTPPITIGEDLLREALKRFEKAVASVVNA